MDLSEVLIFIHTLAYKGIGVFSGKQREFACAVTDCFQIYEKPVAFSGARFLRCIRHSQMLGHLFKLDSLLFAV